jgi:1-deoxy-D-xylulose-5-phosphate synthase
LLKLLPHINSVEDVKRLNTAQLPLLAAELRAYILEVTARNGGHLAPNLGVVELTIALHRVFSVPQDKMIWDVGHQSYAHKILTGRREQFTGLRTFGGIGGFPNTAESPCDCFNTGHSSTSISAALGLATARDLAGERHNVVAVIGDGALTGGLAYEALNNVGDRQARMLVVLNDNEMSIASNVGAISNYLTRLRSHPRYNKLKKRAYTLAGGIPKAGPKLQRFMDRVKDTAKYFLLSRMLFEELGLSYYGPIDGHDLPMLLQMLERVKEIEKPVLLHVLTQKGRGYLPAEQDPQHFHGIGPFDIANGQPVNSNSRQTYSQIFGEFMTQEAEKEPKLLAVSAAMADGVGLLPFAALYPQRFFDVGIAEQHAVTFAAGLAAGGYRPVVAVYSSFLQRAYDQILHDVCLPNLPVLFALDRAGLVGEDGATHQGIYDLSYLRTMPNIQLLVPADGAELAAMLAYARTQNSPLAIRYPRGCPEYALPLHPPVEKGKAVLLRAGEDLLLAACGTMVGVAMEAAELLAARGIEAAVLNARFAAPLDRDTLLAEAAKSGRVLTLEENVLAGGFGAACLEVLRGLPVEVEIAALPGEPIKHGPVSRLREEYGLTPLQIAEKAYKRWFGREDNIEGNRDEG